MNIKPGGVGIGGRSKLKLMDGVGKILMKNLESKDSDGSQNLKRTVMFKMTIYFCFCNEM